MGGSITIYYSYSILTHPNFQKFSNTQQWRRRERRRQQRQRWWQWWMSEQVNEWGWVSGSVGGWLTCIFFSQTGDDAVDLGQVTMVTWSYGSNNWPVMWNDGLINSSIPQWNLPVYDQYNGANFEDWIFSTADVFGVCCNIWFTGLCIPVL